MPHAMTSQRLRIGVVGCGSAGPAAALFLARAGHQVSVLERAREFGPVGAGFLLQPTGLSVLGALGLREAAAKLGAPVTGLYAQTRGGRVLLDLAFPLLGHVPPLRRQMLRSMAGLKRGLLRRSYPARIRLASSGGLETSS